MHSPSPNVERYRLVIVGAGQVGQKVAQLAADVDFDVWVVDDRPDDSTIERFPTAKRMIVGAFADSLREVAIDANTYVVIVTRRRNDDELVLRLVAQFPARYIGMIGNRPKIKAIYDNLLRDGVPEDALKKVYAPLGLNIGSRTDSEIAISIAAELIAHRNLGRVPGQTRRSDSLEDQSRNANSPPHD